MRKITLGAGCVAAALVAMGAAALTQEQSRPLSWTASALITMINPAMPLAAAPGAASAQTYRDALSGLWDIDGVVMDAAAEPVLEKTSCGPAEIAVYSHTTENFWCAAQVDSVRVVASGAPRKSVATKKTANLTAQRAMGPAFEKGEAR
jgi:hypothetical protein